MANNELKTNTEIPEARNNATNNATNALSSYVDEKILAIVNLITECRTDLHEIEKENNLPYGSLTKSQDPKTTFTEKIQEKKDSLNKKIEQHPKSNFFIYSLIQVGLLFAKLLSLIISLITLGLVDIRPVDNRPPEYDLQKLKSELAEIEQKEQIHLTIIEEVQKNTKILNKQLRTILKNKPTPNTYKILPTLTKKINHFSDTLHQYLSNAIENEYEYFQGLNNVHQVHINIRQNPKVFKNTVTTWENFLEQSGNNMIEQHGSIFDKIEKIQKEISGTDAYALLPNHIGTEKQKKDLEQAQIKLNELVDISNHMIDRLPKPTDYKSTEKIRSAKKALGNLVLALDKYNQEEKEQLAAYKPIKKGNGTDTSNTKRLTWKEEPKAAQKSSQAADTSTTKHKDYDKPVKSILKNKMR